jgi:hypothetical protein
VRPSGPRAADLGEEVLRRSLAEFPAVVFTVSGHCMRPHVRDGERAVVVGRSRRRPRLGDVVLVRLPAGLRLHRLVWAPRFRGRWRTKGDGGPLWDPAVDRGEILGTAVEVEGRPLGRRATWAGARALGAALRYRFRRAWGAA